MPTVTSLSPQKKKKERFNLKVDGEFLVEVSSQTVAKFRLSKGKELTQKEIEEILKESEFGLLFDKALRFLGLRPRSQWEIKQYLNKKKVHEHLQMLVLEKLVKMDYIDDVEFSVWWVEQRVQFRPKGKRVLTAELLQKRVEKKDIEKAFEKVEGFDEKKLCVEVAKKKKKQVAKLPLDVQKQKLFSFLTRRGFSFSTVREVVDNLLYNE